MAITKSFSKLIELPWTRRNENHPQHDESLLSQKSNERRVGKGKYAEVFYKRFHS